MQGVAVKPQRIIADIKRVLIRVVSQKAHVKVQFFPHFGGAFVGSFPVWGLVQHWYLWSPLGDCTSCEHFASIKYAHPLFRSNWSFPADVHHFTRSLFVEFLHNLMWGWSFLPCDILLRGLTPTWGSYCDSLNWNFVRVFVLLIWCEFVFLSTHWPICVSQMQFLC